MAYELQSLERAIAVIDELAARRTLRLTDIARALACSPTTALRTLRVLERHGLVLRYGDGTEYALGSRLTEWGERAALNNAFATSVRAVTTDLADRFGVTAHVGLLGEDAITIIDKIDSLRSLVRYSTLGTRMSLNGSAGGKAALAALSPDESARTLADLELNAATPATIVDRGVLETDLKEARSRGFSTEVDEYHEGFCCVACAFRCGRDIYTVSLSGPTVDADALAERGHALRTELLAVTQALPGVSIAF